MEQMFQLAIITNDPFRAESFAKTAQKLSWRLASCIDHPNPREWLRRKAVDVALVDLDLTNAIPLLGDLAAGLPYLPLLAVVTPQHLVQLQEALTGGAAGFVAFPVEAAQFVSAVERAVQSGAQRKAKRRGRIVAVAGIKGGVGRTTIATNLAVALRQRVEEDVILVEAHHGLGDAALMLNLLPRHTLGSLAHEDNLDQDLVHGLLQEHHSRIKALLAPPDATQLVELPVETWRRLLEILAELAPYVIVDTAPVADAVLAEALIQADDVLAITGPDLASLRSAVALLNSLDEEDNVHAHPHVVLNRAGVRGGVSEKASCEQVGQPIAAALPDDPALATFALNRGVPFVLSHPRSILTREMHRLIEGMFELSPAQRSAQSKPRGRLPSIRRRSAEATRV